MRVRSGEEVCQLRMCRKFGVKFGKERRDTSKSERKLMLTWVRLCLISNSYPFPIVVSRNIVS